MTQLTFSHQVDHGICRAEQGLRSETDGDVVLNFTVRETGQALCLSNNLSEIIAFQVVDTRPAYNAVRPDTIALVPDIRVDDAVGGHHDRARELGKFNLLVLPAAAVVTHQMREFLQLGITVRR